MILLFLHVCLKRILRLTLYSVASLYYIYSWCPLPPSLIMGVPLVLDISLLSIWYFTLLKEKNGNPSSQRLHYCKKELLLFETSEECQVVYILECDWHAVILSISYVWFWITTEKSDRTGFHYFLSNLTPAHTHLNSFRALELGKTLLVKRKIRSDTFSGSYKW